MTALGTRLEGRGGDGPVRVSWRPVPGAWTGTLPLWGQPWLAGVLPGQCRVHSTTLPGVPSPQDPPTHPTSGQLLLSRPGTLPIPASPHPKASLSLTAIVALCFLIFITFITPGVSLGHYSHCD